MKFWQYCLSKNAIILPKHLIDSLNIGFQPSSSASLEVIFKMLQNFPIFFSFHCCYFISDPYFVFLKGFRFSFTLNVVKLRDYAYGWYFLFVYCVWHLTWQLTSFGSVNCMYCFFALLLSFYDLSFFFFFFCFPKFLLLDIGTSGPVLSFSYLSPHLLHHFVFCYSFWVVY